jgi:hypothetical protein
VTVLIEKFKRDSVGTPNVVGYKPALLLFCVLLASCGGGGGNGSGGQPPPTPPDPIPFDLIYPGGVSLTDDTQISIVGVADASRLDTVTIKSGNNRTDAQLDSSGHWRASDVPLVAGTDLIQSERRGIAARDSQHRCSIFHS